MSRSSVPFLSSLFRSSEAIDESDAGEGLGVEGAFSPAPDDGIGPQSYPDDCRGPDSGFDLVFVHGLRGSRFKTWMRDGVFWPHDLLKDDLKNVRVITWGYDANIANALTYASLETISGHADTLLSDLVRIRREITRPIIFICHSLGGLIVKQALITSASYYKRYLTLNQIYTSTAGVVFMGTPHRGSSTVSYGEIVAKFAKLLLRQPNDELLQTLRPDSHILDKQRHDFTTISNDMTIVCIREELPTGMGLIVPQVSASYDAFNVMCGAIHANHMSMVKFANNGDEGYKRTIHYIQCIVDERLRKAEPENKMIEARKTEILNALRFPTIGDREEGIDTAYSGTCSWIWGNQPTSDGLSEFIPWLQRSDRLLWISGKAGCGKSTLMKHIYRHPRTRAEIQRSGWAGGKNLILLGYFFHDRGSDDQKSREGMLRSMLVQILDERRDLIPNVFAKWGFFDSNHSGDLTGQLQIPTDFLTWQNLRQSFFKMIESLQDSSLCFFLDGLDEYRMAGREKEYTEEDLDLIYDGENEDEAWGRSQWITDGHKEVSRFIHGLGSFENVKTCISSREMFPFDHEFQALPRIRVHHNTTTAIDQYCINRLDKEVPSLEHASSFASEIVGRSSGVFLWVRLVVDMLIDGKANGNNTQELWNTLERLPSRLGGRGGLYMHMLRNIDRQYLPESKGLFQLVMRWDEIHRDGPRLDIITLFLAQEVHSRDLALSRQVIAKDGVDLKTWNEWQERWETLEKRLKSRCGGLLEGTKRVQFMHQTAKQFLSRRYIWQEAFGIDTSLNPEVFTSLALAGGWIRRLKCCAETNPRRPKKELGINTEPIQWQTGGVTVWREEILYAVALTIGGPMAKDWPYSFREHSRGLLHEISNHSRQIEPE